MKRIIIFTLITYSFLSPSFGQENNQSKTKETTTTTTPKTGDTVIITEWQDVQENNAPKPEKKSKKSNKQNYDSVFGGDISLFSEFNKSMKTGMIVAVISVILIFGLPFFIIFIAFYFRYKNKKAKYRLMEKALESGQPLPASLVKEVNTNKNVYNKGIRNIFTGLGLFIFLWAITGSFGIGTIGLLILCTGVGQVVISYTQSKDQDNTPKN